MRRTKHVLVIGAGIVGLCSAEALLQHGYRVTVVDREPDGSEQCSSGNGGLIVPSHFVPLAAPGMVATGLRMLTNPKSPFGIHGLLSFEVIAWIARFMRASNPAVAARAAPLLRDLNLQSRTEYERLVATMTSEVGYARKGLLMLCRTQKGLDSEIHLAADAAKLGLATEVLDEVGVRQLDPSIQMTVTGGVYFHDDAHLTPRFFVKELSNRVEALGGVVQRNCAIDSFSTQNDVLVSAGEFEADEFVLAAGIWSTPLARTIGIKIPMLAGKGYGFTVSDPPETPSIPSILTEARIAMTPMQDGVRFVGTMELGRIDPEPNLRRIAGLRESISEYYPAFSGDRLMNSGVWTGLRPCSPDGLPYIGRSSKYKNLVIATGHAMMGMSLGPITGRLVADVISDQPLSIPIELMTPDRFA